MVKSLSTANMFAFRKRKFPSEEFKLLNKTDQSSQVNLETCLVWLTSAKFKTKLSRHNTKYIILCFKLKQRAIRRMVNPRDHYFLKGRHSY